MKSLLEKRTIVARELMNLFSGKGGSNVRSINCNDIQKAFELYSDVFGFGFFPLSTKIEFIASKNLPSYVSRDSDGKFYEISFSPKSALNLFTSNHLSNMQKFMNGIEVLIVMFAIAIWDFTDRPGLEVQLLKEWFGKTCDISELSKYFVFKGELLRKAKDITSLAPGRVYQWVYNSCYLDSLLVVMFASALRSVFVPALDVVVQPKLYTCKIASPLQDALKSEASKLVSRNDTNESITCENLRILMMRCRREMRGFSVDSANEVYDMFTEFFPDMKLRVPTFKPGSDEYIRHERAMIQMDELFERPYTSDGVAKRVINWNNINEQFLVFGNSYAQQYAGISVDWKDEGFNTTLNLDNGNIYNLAGMIVLKSPGNAGHYVAYFLGADGYYYFYDDLRGKAVLSDKTAVDRALIETPRRSAPALLFYLRVQGG